jgi:hypothetical protein
VQNHAHGEASSCSIAHSPISVQKDVSHAHLGPCPRPNSRCDQKELADTLIKNMTAGPCPSPSLVEYTKEVLLEIWRNRPDLADACMRSIMDKSQPGNPLTFHAAAEVCEIYLLNVWWSSDPSERHEAKYAKTCLTTMSFLLSAVDYWIAQVLPTPYTLHPGP